MTLARKLVHSTSVAIRWGDMDAQGHVNNTVYFRYMEQARIEWLESLRERAGDLKGQGQVIVNASCTFLAPLFYPGTVDVRMFLDPPGRSSLDSHYELWLDERMYAEGSARIVWIDLRTQRSAPLPERLRALCA